MSSRARPVARLPLLPRRPGRRDDAHLRHARAERHLLVPALAKIFWRGVGVIGRIETLDYFDGEPLEDD
jgi:hypothetical protein